MKSCLNSIHREKQTPLKNHPLEVPKMSQQYVVPYGRQELQDIAPDISVSDLALAILELLS